MARVPSVDLYVKLWNQIKPDVFVNNRRCLADDLKWEFRKVSDTEVEARCVWNYVDDPWKEKGTTLHQFSLFLETMWKWFMHQIPNLAQPIFAYRAHMGTIQVVQQFKILSRIHKNELGEGFLGH